MSKLLVIVGATGKQGGSVINALLSDASTKSTFRLRGLTRDASKPNAKKLTDRGVEMVSGDIGDKGSLEKAFQGAYGVFAVTDYWASMSKDTEVHQGKNIADAAKAAGVEHFVFSTLLGPTKFTDGALSKIEHFDGKAEIAEYATSIGLPCTFYLPGFYMTNVPGSALRKDESSGKWTFNLPCDEDARIPLTNIDHDTGLYVKAIFQNRDTLLGKNIYGAGKYYTPLEIVDAFKKVYPKEGAGATFVSTPKEAFVQAMTAQGTPQHIAEELMENMILLNKEYGYYNNADLKESNSILSSPAATWEDFIKTAPAFKGLE